MQKIPPIRIQNVTVTRFAAEWRATVFVHGQREPEVIEARDLHHLMDKVRDLIGHGPSLLEIEVH